MFLIADPKLVTCHADAAEYAVRINQSIVLVHETRASSPLSGGALWSIRADQLALHRAILPLCADGWAFASAPLLRTMLDLLLSAAVIARKPDEAEYRGFKYTHIFLKDNLNNPVFTKEQRSEIREQISTGIKQLPEESREKAQQFMFKERMYPYWFSPEFARPSDVVEQLCSADVAKLYRLFSGGSHGGYIGLRLLKDQPDEVHPNPRADKRSQEMALAGSIRFTFETFRGCDRSEGASLNEGLSKSFFEKFQSLNPA